MSGKINNCGNLSVGEVGYMYTCEGNEVKYDDRPDKPNRPYELVSNTSELCDTHMIVDVMRFLENHARVTKCEDRRVKRIAILATILHRHARKTMRTCEAGSITWSGKASADGKRECSSARWLMYYLNGNMTMTDDMMVSVTIRVAEIDRMRYLLIHYGADGPVGNVYACTMIGMIREGLSTPTKYAVVREEVGDALSYAKLRVDSDEIPTMKYPDVRLNINWLPSYLSGDRPGSGYIVTYTEPGPHTWDRWSCIIGLESVYAGRAFFENLVLGMLGCVCLPVVDTLMKYVRVRMEVVCVVDLGLMKWVSDMALSCDCDDIAARYLCPILHDTVAGTRRWCVVPA
jgi:hypothetical protein